MPFLGVWSDHICYPSNPFWSFIPIGLWSRGAFKKLTCSSWKLPVGCQKPSSNFKKFRDDPRFWTSTASESRPPTAIDTSTIPQARPHWFYPDFLLFLDSVCYSKTTQTREKITPRTALFSSQDTNLRLRTGLAWLGCRFGACLGSYFQWGTGVIYDQLGTQVGQMGKCIFWKIQAIKIEGQPPQKRCQLGCG